MLKYAPLAFDALNGVFCVYKPEGRSAVRVIETIQSNLTRDLNALPCRPPRQVVEIHEENIDTDLPVITTIPDIADDPLVVGPRCLMEDFRMAAVCPGATHTSGVLVCCIRDGCRKLRKLAGAKFIRVYHVEGKFGMATQDFTPTGPFVERTTWHHITQGKLDRVIAAYQAGHQKNIFNYAGVDLQSQEAYELAMKGLVRPAHTPGQKIPTIVYGLKCVEFKPPDFTLEIHSINETSDYLMKLIHEIGLDLRSSAVCTKVRRIRYGPFMLSHALLRKHWTAEHIIGNIKACRELVTRENLQHQKLLAEVPVESTTLLSSGEEKKFLSGS